MYNPEQIQVHSSFPMLEQQDAGFPWVWHKINWVHDRLWVLIFQLSIIPLSNAAQPFFSPRTVAG